MSISWISHCHKGDKGVKEILGLWNGTWGSLSMARVITFIWGGWGTMKVRSQFSEVSSLPPRRPQSLGSGWQAWQQAPLPAEPSCQSPRLSNPWNRSSVDRKGKRKEAQGTFRNHKSPHVVLKAALRVKRYQTSSNANIKNSCPRINALWLHSSFSANVWCAPKYNVSFIRKKQEQGQMNTSQAWFKH